MTEHLSTGIYPCARHSGRSSGYNRHDPLPSWRLGDDTGERDDKYITRQHVTEQCGGENTARKGTGSGGGGEYGGALYNSGQWSPHW